MVSGKDIDKTIKLVMDSSSNNPYGGKISSKVNILLAIELAELCLDFADNGHNDEAMDLSSAHWKKVIDKLTNNLEEL